MKYSQREYVMRSSQEQITCAEAHLKKKKKKEENWSVKPKVNMTIYSIDKSGRMKKKNPHNVQCHLFYMPSLNLLY